jgi:hypothetical protein
VQLIGLLTPFLVVLLNRVVLKERAPALYAACFVADHALGALLMMSDIGAAGVKFSLTHRGRLARHRPGA